MLKADLHIHSTVSDGSDSIQKIIDTANVKGLDYIAITDHSKRVSMAHGLDGERLRRQWREVDQVNRQVEDVEVLKGIECDILEKGGMDLPDDVLAEADWVIASVHYGQNQSRQQITERILEALENPHVDMLAHPTGRLINRRDPYDVALDQVMAAAVKYHKLLELNANPARLDLNDVYCAAAKLAVEIDGQSHDHPERIEHDRRRIGWLGQRGIRVMRIAAVDVRDELDGVMEFILMVLRERCEALGPALPPPGR